MTAAHISAGRCVSLLSCLERLDGINGTDDVQSRLFEWSTLITFMLSVHTVC